MIDCLLYLEIIFRCSVFRQYLEIISIDIFKFLIYILLLFPLTFPVSKPYPPELIILVVFTGYPSVIKKNTILKKI